MRYTKAEFEQDVRALEKLHHLAVQKHLAGALNGVELKRFLDWVDNEAPKRLRKLQREINGAFFRRRAKNKFPPIKGESWQVVTPEQAKQAQVQGRVVRTNWDGRNNTYEVKD